MLREREGVVKFKTQPTASAVNTAHPSHPPQISSPLALAPKNFWPRKEETTLGLTLVLRSRANPTQSRKEIIMKPSKAVITGAAVAGLFTGSTAVRAYAASASNIAGSSIHNLVDSDAGKHSCKGQNDCKGQGGCKTGDNGCKGKNSCKGKGGCKTADNSCKGKDGCKASKSI